MCLGAQCHQKDTVVTAGHEPATHSSEIDREGCRRETKSTETFFFIFFFNCLLDRAVRCRAGFSLMEIEQISYFIKAISSLKGPWSHYIPRLDDSQDHENKPSCLLTEGDFFLVFPCPFSPWDWNWRELHHSGILKKSLGSSQKLLQFGKQQVKSWTSAH